MRISDWSSDVCSSDLMRFWVGGYGPDHNGSPAEGIGMLVAGEADAGLAGGPLSYTGTAAAAPSPSWVAAHPTLDAIGRASCRERAWTSGEISVVAVSLKKIDNIGIETAHII